MSNYIVKTSDSKDNRATSGIITYYGDGSKLLNIVADDAIYNSGVTYSCPLFLYNLGLGSSIHQDHVNTFHKNSHDGILNFWSQMGSQLSLEQITDYDPYLGRISHPSKTEEKS